MPEVIRLEVEHNIRNQLREYIRNIQDNHRKLLTVFGKLKEVVLPMENDVEKIVSAIFTAAKLPIRNIQFTLDSARSSFIKVITKSPPNGPQNQQFKDGVIWADCVSLLDEDDVTFVTEGTAFYQDRAYTKGLAHSLKSELTGKTCKFTLLRNLTELLKEIRSKAPIDNDLISNTFLEQYRDSVTKILDSNGFQLGKLLTLERELYATEDPKLLFLNFVMNYECVNASESEREPGTLRLKGDAMYNSTTKQLEQLRNFGEELRFRLEDGAESGKSNAVMFASSITLGHREVRHSVRQKID